MKTSLSYNMEPWKDNSESTGRKEIHKLYLHVGFRAIGLVHITGDPEGISKHMYVHMQWFTLFLDLKEVNSCKNTDCS